jgi:hypothetical protein
MQTRLLQAGVTAGVPAPAAGQAAPDAPRCKVSNGNDDRNDD